MTTAAAVALVVEVEVGDFKMESNCADLEVEFPLVLCSLLLFSSFFSVFPLVLTTILVDLVLLPLSLLSADNNTIDLLVPELALLEDFSSLVVTTVVVAEDILGVLPVVFFPFSKDNSWEAFAWGD